jgi:hypothetical protein
VSMVVCGKCWRQIEQFYYEAHIAACKGADPFVPLEVYRFIPREEATT